MMMRTMADRVTEFLTSGDAGWELTKDEFEDSSHTLAVDHPDDPILVQRGSRYFILNRDYIGKPKVVSNNAISSE